MERKPLQGRRLLIVEDEFIVAHHLAMIVESLGGEVAGPVGNLSEATALAECEDIDAAILDVRIGDSTTYELAENLRARRIPVVLSTGYDSGVLPEGLKDAPLLTKPFSDKRIEELASQLFQDAPAAG